MSYQGLTGQYGGIDDSIYLKKLEITPTDNDIDVDLNNHMRDLLTDLRCDRPFFESDQIRSPADPNCITFSEQKLNLRHEGALTTTSPWVLDGQFTDWEFTEKDPRGIATGPDMRKYVEQEKARGSFFKYSPDDDNSVPESGINPRQMVSNIKSMFYPFKDRYQNFEESQDAWHNGGTFQRPRTFAERMNITRDGTIVDLAEATYKNRQDAVTKLSNDPMLAYRYSEPDQKIKIARYGNTRVSQTLNTQDWRANRASAYLDHEVPVVLRNEMMNKAVAMAIVDLAGLRETKQAVFQGATYGDSETVQNMQMRVPNDQVTEILRYTVESQVDPANVKFEGAFLPHNAKRQHSDRKDQDKAEFDQFVLESIARVNQAMAPREMSDLRDNVEYSASDPGIYYEGFNNGRVNVSDRRSQANCTVDEVAREEEKTIANYANVMPRMDEKIGKLSWEDYKQSSRATQDGRQQNRSDPSVQNVKQYNQDQSVHERMAVHARATGDMKDKYANRKYISEDTAQDANCDMGVDNLNNLITGQA